MRLIGIILIWITEVLTGPEHWADLFPNACGDGLQSPTDIRTDQTVYEPSLKDFAIFDTPLPGSTFHIHNNDHSIHVDADGKFYLRNGGLHNIYRTAQFHFHWGHKNHHCSEHTVDGVVAPMEMHIVNWNSDKYHSIGDAAVQPGGLAVLGIHFEVSSEDNPVLEQLVNVLKHVRSQDKKIKTKIPAVSMRNFLPREPDKYYRYNGSLTTIGCFESVIWTVFKQKLAISRSQLHVFRQVLKPAHHRKRFAMHESTAVRTVFEELGIEDNAFEKARLRRQLQETGGRDGGMMYKHDPAVTPGTIETMSEVDLQYKKDVHQDARQTNNQNVRHAPKPESMPSKFVHMHINNYRLNQPLNSRIIYRSFLLFDEHNQSETEVVYTVLNETRERNSANLTNLFSSLVFLCSTVIYLGICS